MLLLLIDVFVSDVFVVVDVFVVIVVDVIVVVVVVDFFVGDLSPEQPRRESLLESK